MPFEIIRGDITEMATDAIVNAANPRPRVGSGVDTGIHTKAGPELLKARKVIGDIPRGAAVSTPGFRLKAKYVIHAVGPIWMGGGNGEEATLRRCYDSALAEAARLNCQSVAFPRLATGNYGFPREKALNIALDAFRDFLLEHDMEIILTVFGRESVALSKQMVSSIQSYIDDNYVLDTLQKEYDLEDAVDPDSQEFRSRRMRRRWEEEEDEPWFGNTPPDGRMPMGSRRSFGSTFAVGGPAPDEAPARAEPKKAAERKKKEKEKEPGKSFFPVRRITRKKTEQESSKSGLANRGQESAPMPTASRPSYNMGPSAGARLPQDIRDLNDLFDGMEEGFSPTLLKLIDRAQKKDPEIYRKANVDRKLFSKIRNNPDYKPTKSTAIAFAMALELNLDETRDFIGRAGYALSRSSKSDIIVTWFIEHHNYDLMELNATLFSFQLPLIGSFRE